MAGGTVDPTPTCLGFTLGGVFALTQAGPSLPACFSALTLSSLGCRQGLALGPQSLAQSLGHCERSADICRMNTGSPYLPASLTSGLLAGQGENQPRETSHPQPLPPPTPLSPLCLAAPSATPGERMSLLVHGEQVLAARGGEGLAGLGWWMWDLW